MSYCGFLAELLTAECDDRSRRRSERRIKAAGFRVRQTLVGASRVGHVPQVLTELTEGRGVWATGAFLPGPGRCSCGEVH